MFLFQSTFKGTMEYSPSGVVNYAEKKVNALLDNARKLAAVKPTSSPTSPVFSSERAPSAQAAKITQTRQQMVSDLEKLAGEISQLKQAIAENKIGKNAAAQMQSTLYSKIDQLESFYKYHALHKWHSEALTAGPKFSEMANDLSTYVNEVRTAKKEQEAFVEPKKAGPSQYLLDVKEFQGNVTRLMARLVDRNSLEYLGYEQKYGKGSKEASAARNAELAQLRELVKNLETLKTMPAGLVIMSRQVEHLTQQLTATKDWSGNISRLKVNEGNAKAWNDETLRIISDIKAYKPKAKQPGEAEKKASPASQKVGTDVNKEEMKKNLEKIKAPSEFEIETDVGLGKKKKKTGPEVGIGTELPDKYTREFQRNIRTPTEEQKREAETSTETGSKKTGGSNISGVVGKKADYEFWYEVGLGAGKNDSAKWKANYAWAENVVKAWKADESTMPALFKGMNDALLTSLVAYTKSMEGDFSDLAQVGADKVQAYLTKAIDVMKQNGWLAASWKPENGFSKEQAVVLLTLVPLAYRKRTDDLVKKTSGMGAADVAKYIYDADAKKSQFAIDSFNETRSLYIRQSELNAKRAEIIAGIAKKEPAEAEDKPPVQTVQNTYSDEQAFNNDWRVKLMGEGGSLRAVMDGKMYSVTKTEEKFLKDSKDAGSAIIQPTDAAINAGRALQPIIDIDQGNALASMATLGVLWEGTSRKEVKAKAKAAGQDASMEVFSYNGKFYALDQGYAQAMGVPDQQVKKEGKAIAKAPLENEHVQEFIREKVRENLTVLGAADDTRVEAYLKSGKFDAGVQNALRSIVTEKTQPVTVQKVETLGALIAQKANSKGVTFEETVLFKAIAAKCGSGGANFESLKQSLMDENGKYRAELKDENGSLKMDAVMAAIERFAPGTAASKAAKQQSGASAEAQYQYSPSGVQQGLGRRAASYLKLDDVSQIKPGAGSKVKKAAGGAKTSQEEVKFSTGTWVDQYLKDSLPQEYLSLTNKQKERVLKVVQDLVEIGAVNRDADRARDVLITAIRKVRDNKDITVQ